jgi:hypothetical protein
MKIIVAALTVASLFSGAAMARDIKVINVTNEGTVVRCGNTVLKDPDANIRAEFNRNCRVYSRQSN